MSPLRTPHTCQRCGGPVCIACGRRVRDSGHVRCRRCYLRGDADGPLRAWCERTGTSLVRLAHAAHVSPRTIRRLAAGRVASPRVVAAVAAVTGLAPEVIVAPSAARRKRWS